MKQLTWTHRFGPGTIVTATFAATLLAVAGCSSGSSADENELRIGHLAHLTGASAGPYGLPFQKGLEMGVDAVNSSGVLGDLTLVVDSQDVGSQVPAAVTQYNQFIQDDVTVLVSPSSTQIRMALGPYVEKDGAMLMSSTVGDMNAEKVPGVFVTNDGNTPDENFGRRLGADEETQRAVLIVDGDNPAFTSLASSFKTGYTEAGGHVVDQVTISAGDSDFAPVITKVKASNPTLIMFSTLSETGGNLLTQMNQSGGFDDTQFAGASSWQKQVFDTAGPAATGAQYAVYWAPDPTGEFEKKFIEAYGEAPNAFAANGYQSAWVIASAANLARDNGDDLSGKSLAKHMHEVAESKILAENGIYPGWKLRENNTASFAGASVEFAKDGSSVVVSS
ncbi:ABC transporter substrate-binding protein [Rhodococcus sp. USK13]|uniref:ABC transporter substrate-binding protein n=1 Tax=Rhodococcus sp. USK13 TaxID=2806442 RepID=UPI001BD0AA5C|nr:ABC transporter substrate-binding protein [Rhodococcus sp. USK13]